MGNILFKRYLKSTKYIKNNLAKKEENGFKLRLNCSKNMLVYITLII